MVDTGQYPIRQILVSCVFGHLHRSSMHSECRITDVFVVEYSTESLTMGLVALWSGQGQQIVTMFESKLFRPVTTQHNVADARTGFRAVVVEAERTS